MRPLWGEAFVGGLPRGMFQVWRTSPRRPVQYGGNAETETQRETDTHPTTPENLILCQIVCPVILENGITPCGGNHTEAKHKVVCKVCRNANNLGFAT